MIQRTPLQPPSPAPDDAEQATLPPDDEAVAGPMSPPIPAPPALAPPPSPAEPFPVKDWERYELLELLGQGGMGAVYKARDRILRRLVALKFIRGGGTQLAKRFLKEARAQARVEHPNVCKVYEVGEVEGKAYIAMELIEGRSLQQAAPHLTLMEKVQLARDAALGLHEAHRLGIVHRDIKPANIMVAQQQDGGLRAVVMDFGLARESGDDEGQSLTQSDAVIGTPIYMSPEQARGHVHSIDRRSDVYSLGATLYELLCGTPPFRPGAFYLVLTQVMTEEPPPLRSRAPEVPADLEVITLKALSKEPERRYGSAREVAAELQRFLDGDPILARPASLAYRVRRKVRRYRGLFLLGTSSVISLLLLSGYAILGRLNARRQAELQQQLGQDLKEMEWFLRAAYGLPLHNVEPEQALIRNRMAAIKARVRSYGDLGQPLAHLALGRGYLALHEPDKGLAHLQEAARSGSPSPELAYALGLASGHLYEQALDELQPDDPRPSRERREALRQQYLVPALDYLRRSRGAQLDAPEYLEGLLAYYNGDYREAVRHAQAAYARAPWLYEARSLEGSAYFRMAREQRDRGEPSAQQSYRLATACYERAAEIGRSDATLYVRLQQVYSDLIEAAGWSGASAQDALEHAAAALDKATTAAPSHYGGYVLGAATYVNLAEAKKVQGQDPRPALDRALAAARDALVRKKGDRAASCLLGAAWNSLAHQQLSHGEDPVPALDAAAAAFRSVLDQDPAYPEALKGMLHVKRLEASYRRQRGEPAESSLTAMMDYAGRYLKSVQDQRRPADYPPILNAYYALCDDRLHRGQDLSDLVEQAGRLAQECFAQNQKFGLCYRALAQSYIDQAEYLSSTGRDPEAALDKAIKTLQQASQLSPGRIWNQADLARAYALGGALAVQSGRDPRDYLERLDSVVQSCLKISTQNAACFLHAAERARLEAAWLLAHRRSVAAVVGQGLARVREAYARNPKGAKALSLRAELLYLLAAQARSAARRRSVRAGLDSAVQALRLNPRLVEALSAQARLLILRADGERGGARRDSLQQAADSVQQALAINPLRRRELGSLLARAQQGAAHPRRERRERAP